MSYQLHDRVIALAGIYQALKLVQQVAQSGFAEPDSLETSISSLFVMDAEHSDEIFGSSTNLRLGLETLIAQLGGSAPNANGNLRLDNELTCYFINVVVLQRKIVSQKEKLNLIADNLRQAKNQVALYGCSHVNVLARIADIYVNCISRLSPRIMVSGEQVYLTNNNNASKIRALLLAAIRAAVLWQQTGGKRWQLLFQRSSYINEAQQLLEAVIATSPQ